MKSLKRSLVFLMVFAMVFTAVAPVFAATPADVVGTTYEDSVSKLAALGIISGDADTGNYRPNDNITRAEFAKIVAYVVGMQTAADLSKGTTKFKDVPSTHWASGFINVASQQGLIKGYPDKTFKPNANVSYAEAITILVRALGLGPVVEGKGTWPANYLAKASSAGVTDEVSGVDGTAKAIRGVIGQLAWNTLKAEEWGESKYTSTGVEYGPLGKSLLQDKYKDFVYKDAAGDYLPKIFEDAQVVKTQLIGGLAEDEVQIQYAGIADALNIDATIDTPRRAGDANNIVVKVNGVDGITIGGKKVDVMFGKDNKVVSFVVKSTVSATGTIDKIDTTGAGKVTIAGKEYTMAATNVIYVNTYAQANISAAKTILDSYDMTGYAVLNDDGQVTLLNMLEADTNAGLKTKQFIVKEIRSNTDVYALKDDARPTLDGKNFNLDEMTGVTGSNKTIFMKDGKLATKADLKVGDVVTWISVSPSLSWVLMSDVKVTGTVASLGYVSATRFEPSINGTIYKMVKGDVSKMTKTGNDADVTDVDTSYTDFNGKSVTLSLNTNGKVMYTVGTVTASANYQYGVLSNDITNYGTRQMEVRTTAGTKVSYTVTGDKYKTVLGGGSVDTTANASWVDTNGGANQRDDNMIKGTFIQYRVNSDGTVSAENIVKLAPADDVATGNPVAATSVTVANSLESKTKSVYAADGDITVDYTAKKITVDGVGSFYYTANTVIFTTNVNSHTVTGVEKNKITEKLDGWDAVATSAGNNFANAAGAFAGANVTNVNDTKVVAAAANRTAYIVYDTDYSTIKYLVVDMQKQFSSSGSFGVLAANPVEYYTGTDKMIKLTTDTGTYEYKVSADVYTTGDEYTSAQGDFVAYTINNEGKFEAPTATYVSAKAARLVDKSRVLANKNGEFDHWVVNAVNTDSRLISFKENANTGYIADTDAAMVDGGTGKVLARTVQLTTDAKVYDISGDTLVMKSITDVKNGQMVYVTADGKVAVIVKQ